MHPAYSPRFVDANIATNRCLTINLMLTVGTHGRHEWLVTDEHFDLLQICPEVVLGKYIAITSIDSGQLVPSEKEAAAGWQNRGKIAYSPKVENPQDLPRAGWDEWYIFDSHPPDLGICHIGENVFEAPQPPRHVSVFVNYNFALHQPEMKDLATLFWEQMAWIRPESYVADNSYLNFVSQNKAIFAAALAAVKALG
jgi:hypothetical protein